VSRANLRLRDAALAYASRGIPVLPLHYPLPHRHGLRPAADRTAPSTTAADGACSCGDQACAQVGKHPLGSLVPHGLTDATCNRARILAWWTHHPHANIGLATGHSFDVLDVDGPTGAQAIRAFAEEHDLQSSGPLVRTGGGWHYYLAPTGLGNVSPRDLEHVDWRGHGGYVVAPPSRHHSGRPYQWVPGRDLGQPLPPVPAPLRQRLQPRQLERPAALVAPLPVVDRSRGRYAQAALAEELARVAAAPKGHRNRQLWESGRNLYNLVAAGALDHHQVHQQLLEAAERSGLLADEPRQTHRTLASARQVGLAHPRPAPECPSPNRTNASPALPTRAAGERDQQRR
jgi:hypothetical protein